MLSLGATELALVALESKDVRWMFYVYDKNGVGYSFTSDPLSSFAWQSGVTFDAGISWDKGASQSNIVLTDFSGIELHRNMAENTIIAPSESAIIA